eukprot:6749997-Alexandrium_andersonii.AAC.1
MCIRDSIHALQLHPAPAAGTEKRASCEPREGCARAASRRKAASPPPDCCPRLVLRCGQAGQWRFA